MTNQKINLVLLAIILSFIGCKQSNSEATSIEIQDKTKSGQSYILGLSYQTINDTIFLLHKALNEKEVMKLYISENSWKESTKLKLFSKGKNRNSEYLFSAARDIPKQIDKKILDKLKGKYLGASIIGDSIFFSPWDYFCANRAVEINDSSIYPIYGCEGYYQQPIISVFKATKNTIAIQSLRFPNATELDVGKSSQNTDYLLHVDRLEEGILMVESNEYQEQNFYCLIKQEKVNSFKELRCHSTSGPCSHKLIKQLIDMTTLKIKEVISKKL